MLAELLYRASRRSSDVIASTWARCAASASRQRRGRVVVEVRAADRFLDDLVDELEPQQVGRRDLQRLGGLDLPRRVAPENRGAALGGMTL